MISVDLVLNPYTRFNQMGVYQMLGRCSGAR